MCFRHFSRDLIIIIIIREYVVTIIHVSFSLSVSINNYNKGGSVRTHHRLRDTGSSPDFVSLHFTKRFCLSHPRSKNGVRTPTRLNDQRTKTGVLH